MAYKFERFVLQNINSSIDVAHFAYITGRLLSEFDNSRGLVRVNCARIAASRWGSSDNCQKRATALVRFEQFSVVHPAK